MNTYAISFKNGKEVEIGEDMAISILEQFEEEGSNTTGFSVWRKDSQFTFAFRLEDVSFIALKEPK